MDPRDVVTPDPYVVASEVLGRPLARPWRRLLAMLVDLVAVGVLAGLPALVLGLVASATCFRAAWRSGDGRSRIRRVLLVSLGFVLLGAAVAGTLFAPGGNSVVHVGAGDERIDVSPGEAVSFAVQLLAVQNAATEIERRTAARALVQTVRSAQPDPDAARALLTEIVEDLDAPEAQAALKDAMVTELASPTAEDPAVTAVRRDLREAERRVTELQAVVRDLQEPQGMLGGLKGLADDLGLGFGWTVVYFTVLTGWWKGRTIGKRLLGCRVVRLDGRPLSWWHAFNRSGGYAASLATGLLGFAEILWDPNRQALHDRICRTVVVRDTGPADVQGA